MKARTVILAGAAVAAVGAAMIVVPSANAADQRGNASVAALADAPADDSDFAAIAADSDQLDAALSRLAPDPDDADDGGSGEVQALAGAPAPCEKFIAKNHTWQSVWQYVTDSEGRPQTAYAKHLSVGNSVRNKECETKVGNWGGKDYQGGHLIAHTLKGVSKRFNLVPQSQSTNLGAVKLMENSAKRCKLKGASVTKYTVQTFYPTSTSVVPNRITMFFHVTISGHTPGDVTMETANNKITKKTMKLIKDNIQAAEKRVGCRD